MNTTSPRHSVSVAAIITDDHDRALLIQRADNGHWEPPGGVLELGETIDGSTTRPGSIWSAGTPTAASECPRISSLARHSSSATLTV